MLFSDPIFLFIFLPATCLLFHGIRIYGNSFLATWVLIAASAVFYGWWSVAFLTLIVGQIVCNFFLARKIEETKSTHLLAAAVFLNLFLLGYFKYRNFFIENTSYLFHTGWEQNLAPLIIPLGISFHTFQQIALLVDVADGETKVPSLKHYLMFVLFFPQLIAGPIVLHREMSRQLLDLEAAKGPGLSYFGPGFYLLVFGLFKKVVLADTFAPFVNQIFSWPVQLQPAEAWAGAVAYALELYFDFSGYSDMAVGLGLMFGLVLPFNFDIPFAATSMIEYWKRWHITMTRFFTMYIYAPLALAFSRYSLGRGYGRWATFTVATIVPILVTFLASGLWHGAGWTFIMFGLVNALGLAINHLWREAHLLRIPRPLAWVLTALTILVSLVYFRSASMEQAHYLLKTMFLPSQIVVPIWAFSLGERLHINVGEYDAFATGAFTLRTIIEILIAAPLAVLLPNPAARPLEIRPDTRAALVCAVMLALAAGSINEPRTFLYFQF